MNDASPEALYHLGLAQLQRNFYEEAAKSFEKSIQIAGFFWEALHCLGTTYGRMGKIQESLRCYYKCLETKPNSHELQFNIAICLDELNHHDEALTHYEQAIYLKSDFAEAWRRKGISLFYLKRFNEALVQYDHAIQLNPDYAEAWSNKGVSLNALKRYDEALAHYDQAIQLNPDYAEAWSNKGVSLNILKRYDEALAHYDQAIQLNPGYAEAWSNKGISLNALKRYDEALAHYDQAIQLNPNYSDAYWNKGLTNLLLTKFDEGWDLYKHRWGKINSEKYRHHQFNELLYIDNLEKKNILVWHEQGLGDSIQFSRYIPQLIKLGANVTFQVQKPLFKLFKKQLSCSVIADTAIESRFDFQVPLLNLPQLFKTNLSNIPSAINFHPTNDDISLWKNKLNLSEKKLNIGVAFSGNSNHTNDLSRSISLNDFSSLFEYGEFFLIQKELNQIDKEKLNQFKNVFFLGDQINDFVDTASIIMNMDLIISVDTSLIHLAGSLNKVSYLMLPWSPEWRWLLDRSDSPWYPSIEIFRQQTLGDWDSVINQIKLKIGLNLHQHTSRASIGLA
jgi:tetratricopeptide (TPR) repeat protein